jgi:hypothetical protein
LEAAICQQPLTCAVTLQAALRCAGVKIGIPADAQSADAGVDAICRAVSVPMRMVCRFTTLYGGLFSSAFMGPDVVKAAPGESASTFSTQLAGLCATSIKAISVCAALIWPADGASADGSDSQQLDGAAAATAALVAEAAPAAVRLACDAARNAAAVAAQQGEPVAAVWIMLVARAGGQLAARKRSSL